MGTWCEAVDACLEKYEEHYLCKKWVEAHRKRLRTRFRTAISGPVGEMSAQVKRSIPRELIDAYEREQRRLMEPASSPTKAKEATPKTSAPTGAPAGKGAVRPPGQGPPGAPPKAAARPSLGALQRTVAARRSVCLLARTTTSSSIASSQGPSGATPAIAQLKDGLETPEQLRSFFQVARRWALAKKFQGVF